MALPEIAVPTVVIADDTPPSVEEIEALRASVGWPPREREAQERAARTGRWVTARAGGVLVGMGRCLSDGALYASIWDMAVRPDYQRHGIGRRIFTELMAPCRDYELVALVATPAGTRLYEAFGFTPQTGGSFAMAMRPKPRA